MAKRDLYQVLGVNRAATEHEIRKAYRELARKHHPDLNPGDKAAEERFKEASYASEVLLNAEKRKLYDEFGELGLREGFDAESFRRYRQRGPGVASGFQGIGSLEDLLGKISSAEGGGGVGSFGDLFGDDVQTLFGRGGRGGRGRRSRSREIVGEVTVELLEAVRGAERELSVQVPGEQPRTMKVRIPVGVREGERVRLRGRGEDGGDIVLVVHVKEHPLLTRSGDDLLLSVPITLGEAMRGAKVQVPTIEGSVALRIPKGAKSGSKLRLRGKGIRRGEDVGDLIAVLQVVPPPLDEAVEAALDTLEAAYPADVRADLKL